jgi:hypothetical protein
MKKNKNRITQEDILKMYRAEQRNRELEDENGWKSKNKAYRAKTDYSRKPKHKGKDWNADDL